jgi:phytoene dehydrogenase-like protein
VDAIFVGAGINSLGAALILARAGWRVLVLDRNETAGGCIRTQAVTLPGFHHDLGAMNLSLFAGSPFYQDHKDDLSRKGVSFATADPSAGTVLPDGRFLGISTDRDRTRQAIAGFSEADATAWDDWTSDFDSCAPYLFDIFGSPAPEGAPLSYAFGDQTDIPAAVQPVLRGILMDSLHANLTARFESTAMQAMIAAWGLHPDFAPDIAGGCFYPFLETNLDARQGIAVVKGGSGRLIDALVALIHDAGGEVRGSAPVEKIVIEQDRCVGVRLTDGEIIRSTRAVIASTTPGALLELLDGQLPPSEAHRARHWRPGVGTLMIHLALSDLPGWEAEDARRSFYVHIGPSLDYLARAYHEGLSGLLSSQPFCVVAHPTLYDPSRAPAGKHVLWIMVRCVPAVIRGDAAGKITGHSWSEEVKEAFADRVLDLIEDYAPGLRDYILARTIQSPTDLQALNSNLVGGDINGGSCHLDQFYGQRPFPDYAHHKMPLDGLYMCGASTWPGAGASPGSGVLAARRILDDHL